MRTGRKPTQPFETGQAIVIWGAREHNLKNLTLTIPRNQLVVITGVSGSGKSTLAFDILFAEGQRRFLDSMNTYARQFVEQMPRPDVDLITGLPPSVSIEQRNSRGGGKSTVATVTEIWHFLRLLFTRLGTVYCPDCQEPVRSQTRDQVGQRLRQELRQRGDLLLLAPVIQNRKGFHTDIATWAARHGYARIRADGRILPSHQPLRLDRFREHNVEVVVGELGRPLAKATASDFPQALVDTALRLGNGTLLAADSQGLGTILSVRFACHQCGRSFEPLDPRMLSYNSSRGWCPRCRGFGELFYLPDVERGANAESIEESWFQWQEGEREPCPDCQGSRLNPLARSVRLDWLQFGAPGIVGQLSRKPVSRRSRSDTATPGFTLDDFARLTVEQAQALFAELKPTGIAAEVARDILPEIRERLRFLHAVGLGYLCLGRGIVTLSSGEAQRIRLAAQLGSNLFGVLYVLDEPTIGLHARDNERLLATLAALRARGNSLVIVEHDEATMRQADYLIDLGPGAGVEGGEVVAAGTFAEILRHPESITGRYLREPRRFPCRGVRRPALRKPSTANGSRVPRASDFAASVLVLAHARKHNLRNLTVAFPLQRLVVVTGVSGSGKSTLIRECLLPTLLRVLQERPGRKPTTTGSRAFHAIESASAPVPLLRGAELLRAVYEVDQSPIGRTPRSTPATYVGVFDDIRRLFAQTPEARLRGYSPSRFSFNSAQGRCPTCEGVGLVKLEMNFLPPAFVRCENCQGSRYARETLDVQWHGRNIAQVLDLSVMEAIDLFSAFPSICRPLAALRDTGLGYLKLGQTSPTLSGGEAQRLKLVTHLLSGLTSRQLVAAHAASETSDASSTRMRSLFLLEEPTIGLHGVDVRKLLDVLHRLIDAGHSVIVIEHQLELIAEADWVIDLGPEGGEAGGLVVAQGTPEMVARNKNSHTGRCLHTLLATS